VTRAFALAAIVLFPLVAPAASGGKREARALFKAGNALLLQGDNVGALEKFEAAFALFPSPKILLNIGTCLREMDRDAEAAEVFERYLSDPEAEAERKAEVSAILAEIDARMGRLRLPLVDAGTRLLLDGKALDARPGSSIRVEVGSHVVVAEKAGSPPTVATVVIAAGEERMVDLVPARPAPPSRLVPPAGAGEPTEVEVVVEQPAIDTPAARPTHRGQVGVSARADVDGEGRGAVLALGVTYGLGHFLEIGLAALLGGHRGVEPGVTALLARGPFKPAIYVGAPVYFVDGVRAGVHAAVGILWDPADHMGVFAGAGIEHFPSVPPGYDSTIFVPSAGLQVRR
jgi:hypothetical protein